MEVETTNGAEQLDASFKVLRLAEGLHVHPARDDASAARAAQVLSEQVHAGRVADDVAAKGPQQTFDIVTWKAEMVVYTAWRHNCTVTTAV